MLSHLIPERLPGAGQFAVPSLIPAGAAGHGARRFPLSRWLRPGQLGGDSIRRVSGQCHGSGSCALDLHPHFPDEGRQFSRDGNLDLVVVHQALPHPREAQVQPVLRLPRELPHPAWLPLLPLGERCAHPRLHPVVRGALHQDPPRVRVAALRDAALLLLSTGGVLRGRESQVTHQLPRVGESHEVTYFGHHHHGRDDLEAPECHEGPDQFPALPRGAEPLHVRLQTQQALVDLIDLLNQFLQNDAVRRQRKLQLAQVALVRLRPVRLPVVVEAQAAKQRQQPCLRPPQVVVRVHAGAAQPSRGTEAR